MKLSLCVFALFYFITIIACIAPVPHASGNKIGKIEWQYEGLNQLSSAMEIAREKDMYVLVGLSGSPG
jgi:hypothetical protein